MSSPSQKLITTYFTLEEMELEHYKTITQIDPVDGIRQTIELICRAYDVTRIDLVNRQRDNTITIDETS